MSICECCGGENICQSYEVVEGYDEKLLVTECKDCDLSFYQEPED